MRKKRPYTSKQCSDQRRLDKGEQKQQSLSARGMRRLLRQGRYVDSMTEGCEGWF